MPPIIFVDVDDTLIRSFGAKRIPMGDMVALVRGLKEHGALLYCWSKCRSLTAEEVLMRLKAR